MIQYTVLSRVVVMVTPGVVTRLRGPGVWGPVVVPLVPVSARGTSHVVSGVLNGSVSLYSSAALFPASRVPFWWSPARRISPSRPRGPIVCGAGRFIVSSPGVVTLP
eukprot:8976569-Pyramimonas_sp.AAC.1